jgi:hypothetical protein
MHHAFHALVDYAGLFPPASCSMAEAVSRYASYREGPDQAMLGRFVVAALRLEELGEEVVRAGLLAPRRPWELAVVFGAHHPDDLARIERFVSRHPEGFVVRAVELKVAAPGEVAVVAGRLDSRWEQYLEVPHQPQYGELIRAIAEVGAGAKIRTGGTVPEAFPSPRVLTRFLLAVTRHGVPWKATAGLHHPWRGSSPLTYAPDSERHDMHGYLNVLLAAAVLRGGAEGEVAEAVLAESDPRAFVHDGDAIRWNGMRITLDDLAAARVDGFRGFGSCSFREPVDELTIGATA